MVSVWQRWVVCHDPLKAQRDADAETVVYALRFFLCADANSDPMALPGSLHRMAPNQLLN
jgi:hypothetical protein